MNSHRKIAIIHEWFTTAAGSEKVVEQLLLLYPDADIFCVVLDEQTVAATSWLRQRKITSSFIQKLPGAKKRYRSYLPLMPLAIEQHDLSAYDLVISSSHAVAKGVLTGPSQLHISYVHSPMRYAWDLQHQYLRESGLDKGLKGWLAKIFLHKLRLWDYRTAAGVDHFIGNSAFIRRRIKKVYGREADVIFPPVDIAAFTLQEKKQDYYLAASRLVPYKRMDMIVQAFAKMPDKRLVVIGDGPDMPKLMAHCAKNIELLGYQEFSALRKHMQDAKAFVFAAEEDFGIIPVEAQACGTPVIAFGRGGALETVVASDDPARATGVFFAEQTVESLIAAVATFESTVAGFSPQVCRANAQRFSTERFVAEFGDYVERRYAEFAAALLIGA